MIVVVVDGICVGVGAIFVMVSDICIGIVRMCLIELVEILNKVKISYALCDE